MAKPIYLDYAATTPVDPRVVEVMQQCLTLEGNFGNPASNTHFYGWQAEEAVAQAREQVANLIQADAGEIIFTSGATEADNLAIQGVAKSYQRKGQHIITTGFEHKAVLDTCAYLADHGFDVTYIKPNAAGVIDVQQIVNAIGKKTILVSVMHVNNEIGTIQPIAEIGALCRQHKILFHVDAAQSAGKIPIDVNAMKIDLLSISGHKFYGPKGIGALYVRRRPKVRLTPLIYGGGHEQGYRSGTLATHQIVGFGKACVLAQEDMLADYDRLQRFKKTLYQAIVDLGGVSLNGAMEHGIANILNVSIDGVDGEALLMALHQLAISSGSACNSATLMPSYVLSAIGRTDQLAHSAIRLSLGRLTTEQEIDQAIKILQHHIPRLRAMSPLWRQSS